MNRILVVDDTAICREPIAEALRARGYDVVCAESGQEALSSLREHRPDLVLLDVVMPDLDGLAVLRTMRRNPEWRSLPVIMLTNKADRESVQRIANLNVQGYVLKNDFSLGTLLAKVEACVDPLIPAVHVPSSGELLPDRQRSRANTRNGAVLVRSAPATTTTVAPISGRGHARSGGALKPEQTQRESLADLKPVITKDELVRLVNQGLELRPLGAAVHNVIAATSASGCTAEDVAKAVSQDQALSIRLLKVANSSAYSRGRPVDSVREAVQRIGVSEVRSMVMTLGVLDQYDQAGAGLLDPHLFWEHSAACGLIASAIARARGAKNPDEYFLWGALHDVGRLILSEHVPDAYAQVREAAQRFDLPLETVEARLMLMDHCDILARALERWQFPRDFIVPVVNHHRSVTTLKRLGEQHGERAGVIALSDRLAHALLLGSSGNDVIYPLEELAEFLSITPSLLTEIVGNVVDETRDLKFSMLARTNETTWPDFATQIEDRIGESLRPLYLGSGSDADATYLFVDRIKSINEERPPNLAIGCLRKAHDLSKMIATLEAEERKFTASNTPLLMVTSDHSIQHDQALLRARPSEILRTPMRIATFVRSIKNLMKGSPLTE